MAPPPQQQQQPPQWGTIPPPQPMWNQQPSQIPPPLPQTQPHPYYGGASAAAAAAAPPHAAPADEVRTLWIGHLQYWMDENYVFGCFAQTGEVRPNRMLNYDRCIVLFLLGVFIDLDFRVACFNFWCR